MFKFVYSKDFMLSRQLVRDLACSSNVVRLHDWNLLLAVKLIYLLGKHSRSDNLIRLVQKTRESKINQQLKKKSSSNGHRLLQNKTNMHGGRATESKC